MGYTFEVVTGTEPFKVIDLTNNGEAYFETKQAAYVRMALLASWGHRYRLEVRPAV